MERQFDRVAVTDAMVEVVCSATDFNEQAAEDLIKRVLAAGALGAVRAKGSHHSPAQLAAIESGASSAEDARQVRLTCVSMVLGSVDKLKSLGDLGNIADALAEYVLTGKKPGAEG